MEENRHFCRVHEQNADFALGTVHYARRRPTYGHLAMVVYALQLLQHSAPHHLQGAALVLFSSFFPTLHTLGFRRRLLTEAPTSQQPHIPLQHRPRETWVRVRAGAGENPRVGAYAICRSLHYFEYFDLWN